MLQNISVDNNSITNFNVAGCVALQNISIDNNLVQNLNVSNLPNLSSLSYRYNPIQTLDVSNCSSITSIDTWPATTVTNLNVQGCTAMTYISCMDNQLITLNVSGLTALTGLQLLRNNITELYIENCTSLEILSLSDNNLSDIDLSQATSLRQLLIDGNNFTTLDVTNNFMLTNLIASNNPLESVLMKNGINETAQLFNCPNLYYVCADEDEFEYIANQYPGINTNSYCTFVPGGNFNAITGTLRIDTESNGCDSNDTALQNVKINIAGEFQTGVTYTNNLGEYTYYAGQETVTLSPEFGAPEYFSFSQPSVTQNFTTTGINAVADFCLAPNGVQPDLDVAIVPIFEARPGFDATYQLIINNKGNQVQSGALNLEFNDILLDYISSSLTPVLITENNITWNFENLAPFQSISISLALSVNSPLEIPPVSINDILHYTATIITDATDETPLDNTLEYDQIVIGSFDPNDKAVIQGPIISPDAVNDFLEYRIRFQNTGTAEAINVVVADVLAANLDVNTFRPVSSSHPYRVTLTGNKAEFFFENINLPAEEDDEAGSNGFIAFKIKPVTGAVIGDVFENTAHIYFDYNAPIVTNTVATTVAILARQDFDFNSNIRVYPNPTNDILTVTPANNFTIQYINIYNMLGQLVIATPSHQATSNVNVSVLKSGNYILEVVTDKGRSTQKIIKM